MIHFCKAVVYPHQSSVIVLQVFNSAILTNAILTRSRLKRMLQKNLSVNMELRRKATKILQRKIANKTALFYKNILKITEPLKKCIIKSIIVKLLVA